MNLFHTHDCLVNNKNQYKQDIITLKKNIMNFKEAQEKMHKKLKTKQSHVNTLEDLNNLTTNKYLQKKQRLIEKKSEVDITKQIQNELTNFQEEVKIEKILENEAKITEAV